MPRPNSTCFQSSDNDEATAIRSAHDNIVSLSSAASQNVQALIEKRFLPSFLFSETPVAPIPARGSNAKKTPLAESVASFVSSTIKKKKFEVRAMLDLAIRLAVVVPDIVSKILSSITADAKELEAQISNHHLSSSLLVCYAEQFALREVRFISHLHLSGLSHLLELASYLLDNNTRDFPCNRAYFLDVSKKAAPSLHAHQQNYISVIRDASKFFSDSVSRHTQPHCLQLFEDLSFLVNKCFLIEKMTSTTNVGGKLPSDKENNDAILPHRAIVNTWMDSVANITAVCAPHVDAPTMFLEEILVSNSQIQESPPSIPHDVSCSPTLATRKPALAGSFDSDAKQLAVDSTKKLVPNWVPPKAAQKPQENDSWFNYCRATSNQLLTKDQLPPNSIYFPCNWCDKVRVCHDSTLAGSFTVGDPDEYGRRPVEITVRQKVPGLRQYNPFIKHREHVKDCTRINMMGWVKTKGKADKDKPKVPNKDLPSFYTDTRSAEDDEGATKEERQMKKKQNEKLVKQKTDEIMFLLAQNPQCVESLGLTMSDIPQRYLNKAPHN